MKIAARRPRPVRSRRPVTAPTDDAELVRAYAATGSEAAFEELLSRHWADSFRIARRIVGDPATAEDVCQQAFIDLARGGAARFDASRAFAPWFRAFVVHRARTAIRSRKRRTHHEDRAAERRPDVDRTAPGGRLASRELAELVHTLPDEVRVPIVLHYWEGLTHREIAATLDCPTGTAASRIRRGMEQLRERLGKAGFAGLAAAPMAKLSEALRDGAPEPGAAPPVPEAGPLLATARRGSLPAAAAAIAVALLMVAIVVGLLGWGRTPPPPSVAGGSPGALAGGSGETGDAAAATGAAGSTDDESADAGAEGADDDGPSEDGGGTALAVGDPKTPEEAPVRRPTPIAIHVVDDLGEAYPANVEIYAHPIQIGEDGNPITLIIPQKNLTIAEGKTDATGRATITLVTGQTYGFDVRSDTNAYYDALHHYQSPPQWDRQGNPMKYVEPARFLPREIWFGPPLGEAFVPKEDEPITIVMPRMAKIIGRITGVPRDAMKTVDVSFDVPGHRTSVKGSARPKPNGRFRTLSVTGEVHLTVSAPGYARQRLVRTVAPGETVELTFHLEPPTIRLFGKVTDHDTGDPIAGARLSAGRQSATSGPGGAYELWLDEEADATLLVTAPGFCRRTVAIPAFPGERRENVGLQLAGEIAIRVVDENGAPAKATGVTLGVGMDIRDIDSIDLMTGKLVRIDEHTTDYVRSQWNGSMISDSPKIAVNGITVVWWGGKQRQEMGTTDDAGTIAAKGLPAGRYRVRIADNMWKGGPWKEVVLERGARAEVNLRIGEEPEPKGDGDADDDAAGDEGD